MSQLIPVTPQYPAQTRGHYLDVDGLHALTLEEDLTIGRWRLVQRSSTIDGEPGMWNHSLSGEARLPPLKLCVLKITPSRVYFDDTRRLVCMSRNGLVGVSGRPCNDCPASFWTEGRGGVQQPPLCSRGYSFLATQDFRSLCIVGAMKTSVRPARRLISLLYTLKQPPWRHWTHVFAEEVKGDKGAYYIMDFRIAEELSPQELEQASELHQQLASLHLTEVHEPSDDIDGCESYGND